MMSCQDFEWRLPLYAAGELAPQESEEVRQHLETCRRCKSMAATLEFAEKNLKFTPCVEPSARRRARVEALLRAGHERRKRWRLTLSAAAAAAILLFAAARIFIPPVKPTPEPMDYASAHLQVAQREQGERVELVGASTLTVEGGTAGAKGPNVDRPTQARTALRHFQQFLPFPLLYPDYLPGGLALEEARMVEETKVIQMTFKGNGQSLSLFQTPALKPVPRRLVEKQLPSGKVLITLSQETESYTVTAVSEYFEEEMLSKVLNSLHKLK
jgi:hypothetical protein